MFETRTEIAVTPGSAVHNAEKYYDSADADRFYTAIWGGEDIHIGLYTHQDISIADASHQTLKQMAEQLGVLGAEARVLDIGAGYGGAARFLARRFGCHVTCLNLSEVQNERNRKLTAHAGLSGKINVVRGNFEALPFAARTFDVVWAQDAILHSGDRPQVLREVARVLRSGGSFIFTDPMQADECPEGVLGPVLSRIHLDSLASPAFYRTHLAELGLEFVSYVPLTQHLGHHYRRVGEELKAHRKQLVGEISEQYVGRMLQGLDHWVDAAGAGHLEWGILHFRAP